MNATIPDLLYNIRRNAKEIAQSRDATEDIADAAAAIIDEATELLERLGGGMLPIPDYLKPTGQPVSVSQFQRDFDRSKNENH